MPLQEIIKLKLDNYVRRAQPENSYWVDFSKQKINNLYIKNYGDIFNIIIYSSEEKDTDYYIIPYSIIKHLFQDSYLTKNNKNDSKKRWTATINNHIFKVSNCPEKVDIKTYFANIYQSNNYIKQPYDNEYEIENKKQEIYVRLKQSLFRRKVLQNFSFTCCVSGITEEDLLVASHIVPWSTNKQIRLDPANGLCLSTLYDKLFDRGYFTLNDDLTIQTINNFENISKTLADILKLISGYKIKKPIQEIKLDYLKYHRENIFIERKY